MVDKGYKLPTRTYLRPTLQYINALGGGVLLDMFNEDEIKKLTVDYITMLYEGKDSVVIDEENEELEEDYDLEDIWCITFANDLQIKRVRNVKQSTKEDSDMQCPKCGNTNLQIITETETKGKDFSVTKGCCGAVLFGWIGILCGACGKGKRTYSTSYWICPNCGYRFKAWAEMNYGLNVWNSVKYSDAIRCRKEVFL